MPGWIVANSSSSEARGIWMRLRFANNQPVDQSPVGSLLWRGGRVPSARRSITAEFTRSPPRSGCLFARTHLRPAVVRDWTGPKSPCPAWVVSGPNRRVRARRRRPGRSAPGARRPCAGLFLRQAVEPPEHLQVLPAGQYSSTAAPWPVRPMRKRNLSAWLLDNVQPGYLYTPGVWPQERG